MNPTPETQSERPTVGSGKVPAWVKVMWIFGVAWILYYIVTGLQHSPIDW